MNLESMTRRKGSVKGGGYENKHGIIGENGKEFLRRIDS